MRHGEKKSNHRKICSCSLVLFKSYKQLHLTFATSCVTCLKITVFHNLDYASAVKSGYVWQKNARRNARDVTGCVRWEGAGLKHNARCGLVAGMKVIGQVFLPRETYTVHYTVKRCEKEGLSGVETYLIGTGLKTKGFGVYCARLESPNMSTNISFHSGLKPTDAVFEYHIFRPLSLIHID